MHQKAPLGDNFRPPMPVHHRTIRTNIDFKKTINNIKVDILQLSKFSIGSCMLNMFHPQEKACPTMKSKRLYKGKPTKPTDVGPFN